MSFDDFSDLSPETKQQLSELADLIVSRQNVSGSENPRILSFFAQGVHDIPSSLGQTASGAYNLVRHPIQTIENLNPREAFESGASMATAYPATIGGAMLGADIGALGGPLAPVTIPLGGLIGGGLGMAGGLMLPQKAEQLLGLKEKTTPKQDLEQLSYLAGQGMGLGGLGQLAKIPASLLGKTIGIAKPLTQAGQEEAALTKLKEFTGNNPNLVNKLTEALTQEPGPLSEFQSPAEITESPGYAKFQQGMKMAFPGEGDLPQMLEKERQAVRKNMLSSIAPETKELTADVLGSKLRDILKNKERASNKIVSDLYEAADPGIDTNMGIVGKGDVQDLKSRLYGRTTKGMAPKVESLFDDFIEKKSLPYKEILNFRQRAGIIADDLKSGLQPDRTGAWLANSIKDAFDNSLDAAVENGKFPEEQINLLNQARQARAEHGDIFNEGIVGKILANKGFGEPIVLDSKIPDQLWATSEAAKQAVRSLADNPEAMDLIRGHVINQLLDQPTPDKINKFIKNNKVQLLNYFEPEQLKNLKTVAQDLTSESNVGELARKATGLGSPTVGYASNIQALKGVLFGGGNVADTLRMIFGGGLGMVAHTLGGPFKSIGPFVGALGGAAVGAIPKIIESVSRPKINQAMMRLALDKNYAAELFSRPTPESFAHILNGFIDQVTPIAQVGVVGNMDTNQNNYQKLISALMEGQNGA